MHHRRAVHAHFAAASRWVACPVSTDTTISYFSLGASLRRVLRELMIRSDMMTSLRSGQARRLVAGYFQDRMVQDLRRKTGVAWRARQYVAAWMTGQAGREVRLRHMPHHEHEVEVFDARTGEHLGAPFPADQASLARAEDRAVGDARCRAYRDEIACAPFVAESPDAGRQTTLKVQENLWLATRLVQASLIRTLISSTTSCDGSRLQRSSREFLAATCSRRLRRATSASCRDCMSTRSNAIIHE